MNIELSAAKAWKETAIAQNPEGVARIALEMVTYNVIERLEHDKEVNFLQELGKIAQDTDGDPKIFALLAAQLVGIAEKQSPEARKAVARQAIRIGMHV